MFLVCGLCIGVGRADAVDVMAEFIQGLHLFTINVVVPSENQLHCGDLQLNQSY